MFSYFQNGVKDTQPEKHIDFPSLINIIKNNPNKTSIETIRQLRIEGNTEYIDFKKKLPNITPNCIVRFRNLKEDNFELNFINSSQYIYFDTDGISNIEEYKQYFIDRYRNQVSMVCRSSS